MIKSLEGNVNFQLSRIKFISHLPSTHFRVHYVSYLHEHFDMLVFPQEAIAEWHPLYHQVQHFLFPLQSLLPLLLPSVSLGAIGGNWLRLQRRWSVRYLCGYHTTYSMTHEPAYVMLESINQLLFVACVQKRVILWRICVPMFPVFKDIVPAELHISHWSTWILGRSAESHPEVCLQREI